MSSDDESEDHQGIDMKQLEIKCEQGMAVIFEHNVFHEGSDVTEGTKYCIRCDVLYSAQQYDNFASVPTS